MILLKLLFGRRLTMCSILMAMLATLGCSSGQTIVRSTQHFPAGTGFVKTSAEVNGVSEPVWVFVPKEYDPARRYPAIVFLHGLFEAGGKGPGHLTAGLGPVIARRADDWPFITIFPRTNGTWKGENRSSLVIAALESAERQYSIDPDRVILAGLSYGALGTWEIGARNPNRFAALVPVSGHRATELVERLAMLPVWAFAMTGDLIVASQSSEEMCNAIAARGGRSKLTEFRGIGHDCWDRAVSESSLVEWMLAQRRQTSSDTSQMTAVADVRE